MASPSLPPDSRLILAIDTAQPGRAVFALVRGDTLLASGQTDDAAGGLPVELDEALAQTGPPALIAAVIGPGGFTGIRAGLALATGLALALDIEIQGVTAGEAIAAALTEPPYNSAPLLICHDGRLGRVSLERIPAGPGPRAASAPPELLEAIQLPALAQADPAAHWIAEPSLLPPLLAARTPPPALARALGAARVGAARAANALPPRPPLPLYGEALAARPVAPLRPPPA